ncbi:MAG: protein-L-isoaspartate(D-aspartate) O-methyltransferase [Planctomycetes bacterium]|nr:protein-L-isoaspartate(D-aspartate) O-methyltransferase [Planctomycetota bacterium]
MVEFDLRRRGITDARLLAAFGKADRKAFVPALDREKAYEDRPLQLTHGQTVSQPYMVALMLQELKLQGSEKVLEIGTGSGYQTALLAELAKEVWTVERIEFLATTAEDRLLDLGYKNIRYRLGDGSLGWPEGAPYDRIVVSAACPDVPDALVEQLGEGGILAVPVGDPNGQVLVVGVKQSGVFEKRRTIDCMFVPLIGAQGFAHWPEQQQKDRAP